MNVLIVDDEVFTVRAMQTTLDWGSFGIERTFSAYNAAKAREIICAEDIHLLICDIEMPKEDGLSLVSWIREQGYAMEVILLTCHSEFEYARKALKLQVFDYVVKPVDFDEVGKTVRRAVDKLKADSQQGLKTQMGEFLLENQKAMETRFWQELLSGRPEESPEAIERRAARQNIIFDKDQVYRLILVSIKKIRILLRHWKDELIIFAVDNLAREVLLKDLDSCRCVRMDDSLVIIRESGDDAQMETLCREYADSCRKFLGISVLCYVSNGVFCEEFSQAYQNLFMLEKDDVAGTEEIVFYGAGGSNQEQKTALALPDSLRECLLCSDREGFLKNYHRFMDEAIACRRLNYTTMVNIFQDILQLFFAYMERHQLKAHTTSLIRFQDMTSVEQLNQWISDCLEILLKPQSQEKATYNEAVAWQVKSYILEHLGEPLSRDSIAEQVNLSPDYMSKMFKTVVGKNLSQYIVDERMEKAVFLMRTTRLNVSQIATEVGCDNFSYFSKLFKKYTGVSPRDYRRKNI